MIAKVNGTVISAEEVEQETKNITMQYQSNVSPAQLKEMQPSIKKQAIETLVSRVLLFFEADKKEIKVPKEKVESEIQHIMSRFPSEAAFKKQLEDSGISSEKVEFDISQQMRIDILVEGYLSKTELAVADDEVETFFKENPKSFYAPEQVKASHILFKFQPSDPQETKDQKRLEMSGLLGQINNGADFAEIAKEKSECPSKQKGGDLDFFEKGKMVEPFEKAAFAMEIGAVSDIIETQFGYHLIKVTDRKDERLFKLEEVKSNIQDHLLNLKKQQGFDTYIQELREGAEIEYA